jgi:hypothetical protein
MASPQRRMMRAILWVVGVSLGLGVLFVAWILVPILTSAPQGTSGQELNVQGFPTTVSATGEDGRTRTVSVNFSSGETPDLGALDVGDRLIVSGSGFDPGTGIYVAICAVPEDVTVKPGPCLGGVPGTEEDGETTAGVIEYAASNWINDDWAWRLFGARSFDDRSAGTFTAYIEIPANADDSVDCTAVRCGLYTRNDHTALDDRVQDLYLPVAFAG